MGKKGFFKKGLHIKQNVALLSEMERSLRLTAPLAIFEILSSKGCVPK